MRSVADRVETWERWALRGPANRHFKLLGGAQNVAVEKRTGLVVRRLTATVPIRSEPRSDQNVQGGSNRCVSVEARIRWRLPYTEERGSGTPLEAGDVLQRLYRGILRNGNREFCRLYRGKNGLY